MNTTLNDGMNQTLMLSSRDVAKLLQCSDRHVTNLWKKGRMPPPAKLGALVRWPRQFIEEWIAIGCPAVAGPPPSGRADPAWQTANQPPKRMQITMEPQGSSETVTEPR